MQFSLSDLPVAAQLSPVYSIASGDFNGDSYPDLILAGIFYGFRLKFGHLDANRGVVLLGKGDGSFVSVLIIREKSAPDFSLSLEGKAFSVFST
jgi:hypothetical protein